MLDPGPKLGLGPASGGGGVGANGGDSEGARLSGLVSLGARLMTLGTGGSFLLSIGEAAAGAVDPGAASGFVTAGTGGRKIELEGSRA
jgi:hypothetical protein